MEQLIVPVVLLVIMIIFGIVFLIMSKNSEERLKTTTRTSRDAKKAQKSNSSSGSKNEIAKDDVFKFMEFDRILDGMIVQNGGSKFTMAIKCKGINYDLMSDIEQLAVEEGFITFLNTLRFPIQLYVQAQNVDLKGAIAKYKENISGIKNEYERLDYQYTKTLEAFDSTTDEIERIEKERGEVLNVYEYASDIINYVERMSYNKNLLQRNFYVLISYHTSEVSAMDKFSKDELVNICYNELLTRCQNVISGLASSSVEGKVLDSNELADLIYTAYNRDDKGLLSVKEAIDSGFYRLYSTSEDAFIKKRKMLAKEIENEAKIKALVALRDSIAKDEYISPKIETLAHQEDISRKASDMINRTPDIPDDIKKSAQERIINDYKAVKKELLEQVAEEKAQIVEEANKVAGKLTTENMQIEQEINNTQQENVNTESDVSNVQTQNYGVQNDNNDTVLQTSNSISMNDNYSSNFDMDSQRISPSEMVRSRMENESSDTYRNVEIQPMSDEQISNNTNENLFVSDDRLGDNSDSNEEDDIII